MDTVNHAFSKEAFNPYNTDTYRAKCGARFDDIDQDGETITSTRVVTCMECIAKASRELR